jgi:hypothetical protein
MIFIFIVLIIRLLIEIAISKNNTEASNNEVMMNNGIRHPAEFELR